MTVCEHSDTLTLTFSDRFFDPLELLQTPRIDGREHADHNSGIYFTLHITVMVGPDLSEFDETEKWCGDAVSDVDPNGESHFTLHMID